MTIYMPALGIGGHASPAPAAGLDLRWARVAFLIAFVVLEVWLYRMRGVGATLSGVVRSWLDGSPGDVRGRRLRTLALATALALIAWHLISGGW